MSILTTLEQEARIRIYGQVIEKFGNEKSSMKKLGFDIEGSPHLIRVHGAYISGVCVQLPNHPWLIVPGAGDEPEGCDFGVNIRMWNVPRDARTALLGVEHGSVEELIVEGGGKGYPKISGHFHIKDIKIENGKLCLTVDARGKIKLTKFGPTASASHNKRHCIDLEGCRTVYEYAGVSFELCVSSNRVCGKIKALGYTLVEHCEEF